MAKENSNTPKKPRFSSWWIYGVIIALILGFQFFGSATFSNTEKTTTSAMQEFLRNGDIEKIVIITNTRKAKIYLTDEAMNKDVDVSYIDTSGTLHLIENGKDMHTLSNKAVGSHDQKAIYRHLTFNTRRLRHQPVSPLTRGQMQRTQITNVLWWYAIPPEAVELRETISEKDQRTLRSIAAAGAGLRIGPRRYTSAQLLEIAERRAW